jgi:all-trans-8'-apo-beta-carotenal 15,15'-oxygenase
VKTSSGLSSSRPAFSGSTTGRGWFGAFQDLSREHTYEPLRISGRIPAELDGTLYRNGPALFDNFGRRYAHWFDGDGAVSATRLSGGRVEGAIKLVQSAGLTAERRAGRPLYAAYGSTFPGTLFSRLNDRSKNAANTSVMVWQDRLFALFENGLPTELSFDDLSTLGECSFEGVIPRVFSAHPRRVPGRKAVYNFGLRYGRQTLLDIIELPDAGPPRLLTSVPVAPSMVHDFLATDDYLIFLIPPMRLKVIRQLLGFGVFDKNFAWRQADGVEVLVVPLAEPRHPFRFEAESFFQFHFSNAYQNGGAIEFDVVRYPDFDTADRWFGGLVTGDPRTPHLGRLHRARLDLESKSMRMEDRFETFCEFPRVSPLVTGLRHRYVYAAAHSSRDASRVGLFDELVKLDVDSGLQSRANLGGAERYVSEPVFVPRTTAAAEDDGWLLAHVYDALADTTHLAVFDACAMDAGAVGRAHFDHRLPITFHGAWRQAKPS